MKYDLRSLKPENGTQLSRIMRMNSRRKKIVDKAFSDGSIT